MCSVSCFALLMFTNIFIFIWTMRIRKYRRWKTDNTMAKRWKDYKTMISITLRRKLKIEQLVSNARTRLTHVLTVAKKLWKKKYGRRNGDYNYNKLNILVVLCLLRNTLRRATRSWISTEIIYYIYRERMWSSGLGRWM